MKISSIRLKVAIAGVKWFIKRPKRNYRIAITRDATSSFLINLTAHYNAIYTVALGANKGEAYENW